MDESTIVRVYDNHRAAKQAFYIANEVEIAAITALKDAQLAAIRLNLITGSNDKAREASLANLTAKETKAAREAEAVGRETKMRMELAEKEVEKVRLLMRLLEYKVRIGQEEAELSDSH